LNQFVTKDNFCVFCLVNIEFTPEQDPVIHYMNCVRNHQALAVDEYERDRLLIEMCKHPECNTGDFYKQIISKLSILKFGEALLPEKILERMK